MGFSTFDADIFGSPIGLLSQQWRRREGRATWYSQGGGLHVKTALIQPLAKLTFFERYIMHSFLNEKSKHEWYFRLICFHAEVGLLLSGYSVQLRQLFLLRQQQC